MNEGQSLLRRGLERAGFGAAFVPTSAPGGAIELHALALAGGAAAPPNELVAGLLRLASPAKAASAGSAMGTSAKTGGLVAGRAEAALERS